MGGGRDLRGAHRRLVTVLAFFSGLASAGAAGPGPGYDIEMSRMVPMRDGVQLETWIVKPAHLTKRVPTILCLSQYDIDGGHRGDFPFFTQRGYAFVQALVRGRGRSGGDKADNLGLQVGRDGYDLVEWFAQQPWSDGHVVMYGGSFVGMTQWRTAAQHPPHLAAIAPYVAVYPGWDVPNTNGIPQAWSAVILGYVSGRTLNTGFIDNQPYWAGKMVEHYATYQPFATLDDAIGLAPDDWWMMDAKGGRSSFMKVWLEHLGEEAFNLAAEPTPEDFRRMEFPILTVTGFYDDDQAGALRYYERDLANATPAAAARHFLVIGPWDHMGAQKPTKTINGLPIGAAAVVDMHALDADWYDFALGRGPRPALLRDRVAYFMSGADEWRYAPSLAAASSGRGLDFYLSDPAGTPEDIYHSGTLARKPSGEEPPAELVSDPHELPELEMMDYVPDENLTSQFRAFQKRAVVFHSPPFSEDTEIAGRMRLTLVCSADAPDFDLWAQVMMVRPDGSAVRLGEDMRRARFRDSQFKSELLSPGQVVEMGFDFNWLAQRIPAGARLRVVVAPLNRPDYQKNFNTGGRLGYEKIEEARVAHIRLYHDAQHASRLTLPLAAAVGAGPRPDAAVK